MNVLHESSCDHGLGMVTGSRHYLAITKSWWRGYRLRCWKCDLNRRLGWRRPRAFAEFLSELRPYERAA